MLNKGELNYFILLALRTKIGTRNPNVLSICYEIGQAKGAEAELVSSMFVVF